MEARLLPLNGLLTLVTRGDINRPVLADAGFRLAGLEIPVLRPTGNVVIDVLLFHEATNHFVQCESKSGANIEVHQAQTYADVPAATIVQAAYVTVPHRADLSVETLYVCLAEHVDRIRLGLEQAGVSFPVLAVSAEGVDLHNEQHASDLLRDTLGCAPVAFAAPPARIIPFDHDSPAEEIQKYVLAELVAQLASRSTHISLTGLTERVSGHYALYSQRVQQRLRTAVGVAVRACVANTPDTFAYEPPTGNHLEGVVRFLKTPEDLDPRGRTQAYQALGRPGKTSRGRPRVIDPNQLDLLAELDVADTGDEDSSLAEEEGGHP